MVPGIAGFDGLTIRPEHDKQGHGAGRLSISVVSIYQEPANPKPEAK